MLKLPTPYQAQHKKKTVASVTSTCSNECCHKSDIHIFFPIISWFVYQPDHVFLLMFSLLLDFAHHTPRSWCSRNLLWLKHHQVACHLASQSSQMVLDSANGSLITLITLKIQPLAMMAPIWWESLHVRQNSLTINQWSRFQKHTNKFRKLSVVQVSLISS